MTKHIPGLASTIEDQRLAALRSYRVVDAARIDGLERIAALACASLDVSRAWFAFLDADSCRQLGCVGNDRISMRQSTSPCEAVLTGRGAFVIPDLDADPWFTKVQFRPELSGLRFHAGAALTAARGDRIGVLCIADPTPRSTFSEGQLRLLESFAALAMEHLELRRAGFESAASMGFAKAAEYSFIAVDGKGAIAFVNPAGEALFGYSPGEMIGQEIDIIIPEPFREAHKVGLARIAAGCPSKLAGRTMELTAQHRDGTIFPIEFSMSVWNDAAGIGIGAIIRDISEWRERDARLVQMAHQDKLTSLASRAFFDEQLQAALSGGQSATVILLDLDGFEEVTDSLGSSTGEALLKAVAVRLPSCVGPDTVVARFGGDEFGLLLRGAEDPIAAERCAAGLLESFQMPFQVSGHTFHVGLSIGAAIGTGAETTGDDLVADADLALYQARRDGRRCFRLFDPTMRSAVVARRALHDDITRGLEASEFVLHYQPQVSLESGRLIGVEALLRWQHPQRGLLMPGVFIDAVEAHPLAVSLGRWIVAEACRQAALWRSQMLPPIRIGVNLFGSHLRDGTLAQEVMAALSEHRLEPGTLEIEVTERIALQADDSILDPIRELHGHGVAIAFDDFGTGYASLSSLKRFPLTRLKIDRSFVRDILTDRHDAEIVRAILAMAESFGLDVIAEGIETREQEAILREMGCREGQGYLYGKAIEPDAVARLVRQGPVTALRENAA